MFGTNSLGRTQAVRPVELGNVSQALQSSLAVKARPEILDPNLNILFPDSWCIVIPSLWIE